MKKIAWLMAVMLLLTCLVACSDRQQGSELEDAFTCVNTDGGVEIVYYSGSYSSLEIPSEIGGKKVVAIGDEVFAGKYLLTEIVIPDTVTRIGDRAFQGCRALERIVIPDSVVSIGDYAFFGCWAAKTLEIGSGLNSMGRQAIQYCKSLESVTVSADNHKYAATDEGILFTADYKTLLCYPSASPMTTYTVPQNCVEIDDYAFRNCVNLETVIIGSHVLEIGDGAFTACTALKNVTLGGGTEFLGYSTFSDCTALEEIIIPHGVKTIGYLMEEGECGSTFDGCTALKRVVLPASLTNIYTHSFNGCIAINEVAFCGTASEWKSVMIGQGNEPLTSAPIIFDYTVE